MTATMRWKGNAVYYKAIRKVQSAVKKSVTAVRKEMLTVLRGQRLRPGRNDPTAIIARGLRQKTWLRSGAVHGYAGAFGALARAWNKGGAIRAGYGSGAAGAAASKAGGRAKALAIPIHPAAQRAASPREFKDLVAVKRPGKATLLIRPRGSRTLRNAEGRIRRVTADTRFDLMYALVRQVRIKAHGWKDKAVSRAGGAVKQIMKTPYQTS